MIGSAPRWKSASPGPRSNRCSVKPVLNASFSRIRFHSGALSHARFDSANAQSRARCHLLSLGGSGPEFRRELAGGSETCSSPAARGRRRARPCISRPRGLVPTHASRPCLTGHRPAIPTSSVPVLIVPFRTSAIGLISPRDGFKAAVIFLKIHSFTRPEPPIAGGPASVIPRGSPERNLTSR